MSVTNEMRELVWAAYGVVSDADDHAKDNEDVYRAIGALKDKLEAAMERHEAEFYGAGSEPIQAPVTLDDVARLSQELCDEVQRRAAAHNAYVSERVASLRAAVDASPGIDGETAGVVLMNKINDMLKDVLK